MLFWPDFPYRSFLIFFWAYIYPKMGVEWNVYTRYAIELTFLFVVIIVVALFYKKREKWQTEESQ